MAISNTSISGRSIAGIRLALGASLVHVISTSSGTSKITYNANGSIHIITTMDGFAGYLIVGSMGYPRSHVTAIGQVI